jgi:hypothetical protein
MPVLLGKFRFEFAETKPIADSNYLCYALGKAQIVRLFNEEASTVNYPGLKRLGLHLNPKVGHQRLIDGSPLNLSCGIHIRIA